MVLAGNVIETHPVKRLRRQPKSVTGLLQNQGEGAEELEERERGEDSPLGLVRFLEPESQGAGSLADFWRNPPGIGIPF